MGLDIRQIINTVQKLSKADPADFDLHQVVELLLTGDMALQGLFPWSSNYTFLVSLTRPSTPAEEVLAVYKPCRGERTLWDFPEGTLCRREFASYLVSQALGWPRIPPVVFRENGPHGPGSAQLFINADYEAHYFNLRHLPLFTEDFRRIALFDDIVNNADRKGGHCLKDKNGQIWAIDHGLTFHVERKLRTVIWEFSDENIAAPLLRDLKRLRELLDEPGEFYQALAQVITLAEMRAFRRRVDRLLATARFPRMDFGHNMPYPPI